MIDLYYWPTPNGRKIGIMLEECGLDYNTVPVHIGHGEQFEPDFLKISPNNRIPAIIDHDAEGGPLSLFESGAILEYLAEKTGQFMPRDLHGRYEVLQWLYWQMAGLGPMMGQVHHFFRYGPQMTDKDLSYPAERYWNEGHRLMRVMNTRLNDRDYLAGDYSIADMASWPWVQKREEFDYDMSKFPNLVRWIEAIGARPAVRRARAQARKVVDEYKPPRELDEQTRKVLFGQK